MATTTPDTALSASIDLFYRELCADPLLRTFYGDSGYRNFGYWDESTGDAAAAGDRLVDALLDLSPARQWRRHRSGVASPPAVLDVACGQGGTTRRLAHHFGPSAITGIGLSDAQLDEAGRRAPGCTFRRMSATDLEFPDATFDIVCSIEAAFHFDTRAQFFAEALRVLKPEGYLLLSDLLTTWGTPLVPPENHLPGVPAYEALLRSCRFDHVVVFDATGQTWHAFRRRLTRFLLETPSRYGVPLGLRDLLAANAACAWAIRASLLAAARRPGA